MTNLEQLEEKIKGLYQRMVELTNPICGECTPPFHCCCLAGCFNARDWAKQVYGVDLKAVREGGILYLGEDGCIVPHPWLRSMCSQWLCPEGLKKAPQEFYQLRAKIVTLEAKRMRDPEWNWNKSQSR